MAAISLVGQFEIYFEHNVTYKEIHKRLENKKKGKK